MRPYDYLIVGAGFFGAVFAYEASMRGKRCLVIDRRPHIGGNAFCENISGITVHKYGPHIFHTNSLKIWRYVNKFAEFNRFVNSPLALYKGRIYNLPFNMNTFYQLWRVVTPAEAQKKLEEETAPYKHILPSNLEEQALMLVGRDIYEIFIKGYTEKQWGRPCNMLPPSIIRRIPMRFTYDNSYFSDAYQGIPCGGYNNIFEKLLNGCEVRLSVDFSCDKKIDALADRVVYTGPLDEYFAYCYGPLEYRSLKFETSLIYSSNYQGNAVVNYTEFNIPYTRIIEHKHFDFGMQPNTVITKEFPAEWSLDCEPFYPVENDYNLKLYSKYAALARREINVIFGGRLAEYKYYNMDEVVGKALSIARSELGDEEEL